MIRLTETLNLILIVSEQSLSSFLNLYFSLFFFLPAGSSTVNFSFRIIWVIFLLTLKLDCVIRYTDIIVSSASGGVFSAFMS